MKDPLFTCKVCGVQSTVKETIDRQFCHNLHKGSHSYGKTSEIKKIPRSPKGMSFSKWRKMFNEQEN